MPPALQATESRVRDRKVTIHLSDVNREEQLPDRILTLAHPTWIAEIGRGSSNDDLIVPAHDNGWFTSKVMSRQHAIIKADPLARIVTLRDVGSMHGTYLNGKRVTGEAVELLHEDTITFGTDITRQADTFAPLRTIITYEWATSEGALAKPHARNTFTADYSEEDLFSEVAEDAEDEIEIVGEAVRQPSVEIIEPDSIRPAVSSVTTSPSTKSADPTSSTSSMPTSSPSILSEKEKTIIMMHEDAGEFIESDFDSESDSDLDTDDVSPPLSDIDSLHPSDDDDDVPIIFTRSIKKSVSASLLMPEDKATRQPSPSDAAMAKPRPSSPLRAPPFPPDAIPPPPVNAFTAAPRPHFGVGGLPPLSTPVDPVCPASNTKYAYNCWTPYFNEPSSAYQTNVGLGAFDYTFKSYPAPSSKPALTPTWSCGSGPMLNPSYKSNNFSGSQEFPMPFPSSQPSSSKQPLDVHTRSSLSPATLKRKADDMSECDSLDYNVDDWSDHEACSLHVPSPPRVPINLRVTTPPPLPTRIACGSTVSPLDIVSKSQDLAATEEGPTQASTAEETPVQKKVSFSIEPAVVIQEPPRKKVKKSQPDTGRRSSMVATVAKYAATASAGAIVGAIGTVFGLAALPADYFS